MVPRRQDCVHGAHKAACGPADRGLLHHHGVSPGRHIGDHRCGGNDDDNGDDDDARAFSFFEIYSSTDDV